MLGNIPLKKGFESEGVCLFFKNPKQEQSNESTSIMR
jgi:hypothetical protein